MEDAPHRDRVYRSASILHSQSESLPPYFPPPPNLNLK